MDGAPLARPHIPKEIYEPSLLGTACFLVYAPALFMLPGWLARVVADSTLPLVVRVAIDVPLLVLAAFGLQLMGSVGHDGTHLSLFRRKLPSTVVGVFYSSAIPTYFEVGFAMSHRNHHRFTNTDDDPNVQLLRHLTRWWERMLFTTLTYNYAHWRTTVRTALGYPWPTTYRLAFSDRVIRLLAWLNLLFAVVWLALYVTVTWHDPRTGVFMYWLPIGILLLLGSAQQYIDHAGCGAAWFRNAWSRTSPLQTVVFCGANFHLEHHAYPGVPSYRLPRLHRHLVATGFYDRLRPPTVATFLGPYRYVAHDLPAREEKPACGS